MVKMMGQKERIQENAFSIVAYYEGQACLVATQKSVHKNAMFFLICVYKT